MKKLLLFLMICIPVLVVLIVKLTASVAVGQIFISVESITLNQESVVTMVGDSIDLTYTLQPINASNKDVIWNSDNESAAVVDSKGHVEFVGIGSGYITAITQDGNMRAQCYFYIYDTKVHGVDIDCPQNYVHIGESLQLSAIILPDEAINKNVTFTSSSSEIATVDTNGLVQGLKEGNVTITVTTEDGNFSDSVDLSVIKPVTALVAEQKEVITSSSTVQIEFTIQPLDATNKNVRFFVDDETVAQVNHVGVLSFLKPGEVNVTIQTVDGGFEQTIKYIYTGGYAYDLVLSDLTLNMSVDDDPVFIEYETLPEHLFETSVTFSSDDENVAYVDANGWLHALKGGNTVVRVRVNKNPREVIEKQIYVNVQSPAKKVVLEDAMTADKTFQLHPTSEPEDSTNSAYFYHVDNPALASVSETGLVTFLTDEACTVAITVYANEDLSDVSKTIHVTYTAGKAGSFELLDKNLTLSFGEQVSLNYEVLPKNVVLQPLKISVVSTQSKADAVVQVLEDGSILAVGGGSARLQVEFELYDGTVVTQFCDVNVIREPSDIEISVALEEYNGRFLTSEKEVDFSGKVLPLDSTETNIVWSVDNSNVAIISGNTLIFNRTGSVVLTATVGGISNSIEIYYTGSNPVDAQIVALFDGRKEAIPESVMVGDSFEIQAEAVVPSTITNPVISIQATNQKTVSAGGVVFEIVDNKVTAVAGGSATLIIHVGDYIQKYVEITSIRMPQSITVLQANTEVVSSTVNLIGEVLPYDTTNQKLQYIVRNPEVASVQGSVLTFKKNGTAYITAICEADNSIRTDEFYIKKVEKDVVLVSCDQKSVSVNKGDVLNFKCDKAYTLQIKKMEPLVEGTVVAEIEDRFLKTISAGTVTLLVKTEDQTYEIAIEVKQLVEQIVFKSNFDMVEDEYVVASKTVQLDFEVVPVYAVNKNLSINFVRSVSAEGRNERIAYVDSDNCLHFMKAGSVTLEVCSADGNCKTTIKLKNTYGDALDAKLNVEDELVLNVGEQKTIEVEKWLPFDTENTLMVMYEAAASEKSVISINSKTNTIKAIASGETKLIVELSNGIMKTISVRVVNKVLGIEVEENILTAKDTYSIHAVALPNDATNKTLEYVLEDTDIATIDGNTLHFLKAGTVEVVVKTTDGSNIEKTVHVTSTLGYVCQVVLDSSEIQILKNSSVRLSAKRLPVDCTEALQFKVLTQEAAYGLQQDVISLTQDGKVVGLCGGTATVRIFACGSDGEEIFADCKIVVTSPVESIEVQFKNEMEHYQNQNTYITSKSEIEFEIVVQPFDATIKDFVCEVSDSGIAKVEGNKIIFLKEGMVNVKFKSEDSAHGEKSKTYSFYYVGNDLIEATLDKTHIDGNNIYLEAGEQFKFRLSKVLPSDNEGLQFGLKDVVEKRNDPSKQVAEFVDGTLFALNGGSYSFTLYVNNKKLETLTLIVTRKAVGINIEGDENVYVSEPFYTIVASVIESDSSQNRIGFKSNNDSVATVSQSGNVTFNMFGKCEITVYVVDNPSIFKVVCIEYTKELQAIKFNQTRQDMYVGESVDLVVYPQPYDADEFEYTMQVKDLTGEAEESTFADLVKLSEGYRLIGVSAGSVVVTAKVVGKDISISRTFNFYEKINDISLELDASGDVQGQGEYRVFGNQFFNAKNEITNTYQMKVSLIPTQCSLDLLEWFSSDVDVATVDNQGVVTFKGTGRVTITVKQKVQFEGAKVKSDSYQFVVVNGINVENLEQFKIAITKLTEANAELKEDFMALVLQSDICLDSSFGTVTFNYNVYGNGKMLDHSQANNSVFAKFYLARSNVVIDNVILRGIAFDKPAQLKDSGRTLAISDCSNILLYNVIFENAETTLDINCSEVKVEGCIFRNCLSSGININRSETASSTVTVKDSIFASSFCGILFVFHDFNSPQDNKLILQGEVRFYNWSTLDQINQGIDVEKLLGDIGLSIAANEVYKQVKNIVAKQKDFAYKYNNQDYYNVGVFQMQIGPILNKTFKGTGVVDRDGLNASCNYTDIHDKAAINFAATVPLEYRILSLANTNPFIKPGDTYVGNAAVMRLIKQPCRF